MSTSDTGAPVQKRLRVSRACEQCRSKKIKCDGVQPTCSPCSSQSIQCSYGSSPKKRGLVPGSVSALERSVKLLQRILGLLLVSVKAADKALFALIEQYAANLLDDSEDGLRLTKAWKEGIVFEALETLQSSGAGGLKCQKPLSLDKDIDNLTGSTHARFRVEFSPKDDNEPKPKSPRSPNQEPRSIAGPGASHQANQRNEEMQGLEVGQNMVEIGGLENSRDGNVVSQNGGSTGVNGISFVQPTSDVPTPNFGSEGFSRLHHPYSPLNPPATASMNSPTTSYLPYGSIYISRSDFAHPTPSPSHSDRPARFPQLQRGDTAIDATNIPSNFRLLIDIYFSYSHAWFPILDKYDIVRLVHTINTPASSSNLVVASQQVGPGKRALLYALLALASAQNEGVVKQQGKDKTSGPDTLISPVISTELYMSSQKLLFESKEYGLEHVQALLLLSLVSISQLQLSTAWLLIGLAGRISSDIGLNTADSTPFRRRTWMGYMVLECLMALWMERKPHVIDSDWGVLAIPEDGWEEWDVWKGVPEIEAPENMGGGGHEPAHITSVFNQLVKLSRIVRRIAIQPSHQARQDPDLETQRKTLLQQLRSWARDLPQAYSLNISTYSIPRLSPISSMPHTLNLHLLYLHALLRLHQAPIFSLSHLDDASRAIKENAISATEVILETYNSHRSLGVAPCPFIHYAASIFNDSMASEGPDNPASRVAKIFNNNLMSFCNPDGFEPGRALFRNAHTPSQAMGPVKSAPTPSHKQNAGLGRSPGFIPCSSSPSIVGGSSDNGMMQDYYSSTGSMGTTHIRERLPPRQPPSMSLREEDLNASNIATSASTGLQPLPFPMFQQKPQQSAVSPDTLDDEFGMFDLPWFV